ncbi:hypothetical protein BS78_04G053700 [Paspalum vaginatum]|nr:hypothetical protein BS78_04G053700 [Paspalum vaginatum]
MGDTGANMTHWSGLYGGGGAAEAAAGGSVSSPTSGGSGGGGGNSPTRAAHHQPGVEGGRVGKPARRRSRASRRAPVTLLNTDTSNFRAMVQQFTGIPAVPAGPYGGGPGGGPVISFGAAGGGGEYGALVRPSPTSAVMSFDHQLAGAARGPPAPPGSSSSLQGQQQQQQLFRPQHHQYGGGYGGGGLHGDMSSPSPFFHGFDTSAEDRMLLQSMQAAQMMPARPASTANNGNGYSFG